MASGHHWPDLCQYSPRFQQFGLVPSSSVIPKNNITTMSQPPASSTHSPSSPNESIHPGRHSQNYQASRSVAISPPQVASPHQYPPPPSYDHEPRRATPMQHPSQLQSIQPHPSHHHMHSQLEPQYPLQYMPQNQQVAYAMHNGIPQYQTLPAQSSAIVPPSGGEGTKKRQRAPQACDICSERKVKCGSSGPGGPPCNGCISLNQACTFNRQFKRRGPINRFAKEDNDRQRQRIDNRFSEPQQSPSSASPEINREPAEVLASISLRTGSGSFHSNNDIRPQPLAHLDLEVLLCPKYLLNHLIDDFFTYIHPLAPLPHEPSFRKAYEEELYAKDSKFFALVCSMVATLVSSFPRKVREHLRDYNLLAQFATSMVFVEKCHRAATLGRGGGYLDDNLTIYDGVTSYFLGLAAAYTFQLRRARLYLAETLTIIRVLGAHEAAVQSLSGLGFLYPNEASPAALPPVDYIQQQMERRLFWTMIVSVRSLHQQTSGYGELLIPQQTKADPYPPLPAEVDDQYIKTDVIEEQPAGIISRLRGFNLGCKIYNSLAPLVTMEVAYGIDQLFDWNRQNRVLNDCYESVEMLLQEIPPELLLKPGPNIGNFAPTTHNQHATVNYPNGQLGGDVWSHSRRMIQFEIQKANIYASQLCTRSYIVEKFFNLQDSIERRTGIMRTSVSPVLPVQGSGAIDGQDSQGNISAGLEKRVHEEREGIVKELLKVLGNISQENMEPNGRSFVDKVRQVASTLIDSKETRKGPLAIRAEESLGQLLAILVKLDVTSSSSEGNMELASKEDDLRLWADLRDCQLRFLQDGGFMSMS